MEFLQKLKIKIELPHDSAIPHLGINVMECASRYDGATCTPCLLQHYLQYPSLGSSPDAMQIMNGLRKCGIYIYIYIYIYNAVLLSLKEE
jgi:hypothetical protein